MTEPEQPPGTPDDRELEQFLSRRSPVSQRYREAATDAAPPALDAKILALAAVVPVSTRRRVARWTVPLASAASLLLVFGVVRLILHDDPGSAVTLGQSSAPGAEQPLPQSLNGLLADAKTEAKAQPRFEPPAAPAVRESAPAMKRAETDDRVAAAEQAPKPLPPPQALRLAAAEATSKASSAPAMAGSLVTPERERSLDPCPSQADGSAASQATQGQTAAPDAWIARIRKLRDTQQLPAARSELACLVSRYPQQVMPDDLRLLVTPP